MPHEISCDLVPALLMGNDAQVMQGIGMAGVYLEDLTIDRFGPREVACVVILQPDGQCFSGCHNTTLAMAAGLCPVG